VDTGRVDGWNDPRMPTVQGIIRRGLRIEALREFILSQGASKNVTFQEWDKIWATNKKIIDPVCPRHTAIEDEARVPLTITNVPAEQELTTVAKHKKYPPAGETTRPGSYLGTHPCVVDCQPCAPGECMCIPLAGFICAAQGIVLPPSMLSTRPGGKLTPADPCPPPPPPAGNKVVIRGPKVWLEQVDAAVLTEGEEVTLMDWGNVKVAAVTKDASGAVTAASAEFVPNGDFKKTKYKLTWLAAHEELVPLTLVDFDYLINKKKVEEDDDFMSLVNEHTRWDAAGAVGLGGSAGAVGVVLGMPGMILHKEPQSALWRCACLSNGACCSSSHGSSTAACEHIPSWARAPQHPPHLRSAAPSTPALRSTLHTCAPPSPFSPADHSRLPAAGLRPLPPAT
jgi:glutamyl/glutaminyl-tRNA synthetase